jgi:hypothetical protein
MSQLMPILTARPVVYFIEFKPYAPPAIIDSAYVQLVTLESLTGGVSDDALKGSMNVFTGLEGRTGVSTGFSWPMSKARAEFLSGSLAGHRWRPVMRRNPIIMLRMGSCKQLE